MNQAFENVEQLLNELRPMLLEMGVSEKACAMPTGYVESISADDYMTAFDFLHVISLSTEWAAVLKARALIPESHWVNLKLMGAHGLAEQKQLERSFIGLRRLWKSNRPCFFGRHIEQPEPYGADEPVAEELVEGKTLSRRERRKLRQQGS